MKNLVVNGVYEHIGNGGISFGVTNENGPTIEVEASHFGHITNTIKLHGTKETLLNLSKMFAEAAKMDFGKDYCCSSDSYILDKETGKSISKDERVCCSPYGNSGNAKIQPVEA